MKRYLFLTLCFLILGADTGVFASDLKDSKAQKNGMPHALLLKSTGSITVRKEGQSISLWASKSTIEEILQKVADQNNVILKFYCQDPLLRQERAADLKISADSIITLLGQLFAGDHRFEPLNREGNPSENQKEIFSVNIYPKECIATKDPVRVFIAERAHPLLRKPLEQISIEELRDVLKREGPSSRRWAADILGRKGDEEGLPYAKDALRDDNIRVMFAGANALLRLGKKYGPEKVEDALYQRFLEKPYGELLLVMSQLTSDKIWPMVDGLIDQSGDSDCAIITRALFLTNDRRAIKYLAKIASTGSIENARQAIYAIGKLGGPEAASVLMRLLKEGDAQRQARAAQAVHFLPEDEGLDVRTEVEKIARQETASALLFRALAEASYWEPLKNLMRDPASRPELKTRALNAIANVGGEKTIEVMAIGLNDHRPEVRLTAVEALGIAVTEAAIPYLIRASEDGDAKVRLSAIKGLSGFPGDDHVVEAIGKRIDDTNERVRRQAIDGFGALGRPSDAMIEILRKCESKNDPYVVNRAGFILSRWGLK